MSIFAYICSMMNSNFSGAPLEQHLGQVFYSLLHTKTCLTPQEIAGLTGISESEVSDCLKQLAEIGIAEQASAAHGLVYSPQLNNEEAKLMILSIKEERQNFARSRAVLFSKRRQGAVDWIDETLEAIHKAKRGVFKR